jgi:hypothetical protein
MAIGKDIVIEKLRAALRGALSEVKSDPNFAPKVLQTVCTELGLDPIASMYLSGKFKSFLNKKAQDDSTNTTNV